MPFISCPYSKPNLSLTYPEPVPHPHPDQVRSRYSLPGDSDLCVLIGFPADPMFGTTDEGMTLTLHFCCDAIKQACADTISPTRLLALVVRPHPRSSASLLEAMEATCHQATKCLTDTTKNGVVLFDRSSGVDNRSLLGAAGLSLSAGSTMALESCVVGCPTAILSKFVPDGDANVKKQSPSFGSPAMPFLHEPADLVTAFKKVQKLLVKLC